MAGWEYQAPNGSTLGPFTSKQIAELAGKGEIAVEGHVRHDEKTHGKWVPVTKVSGLKSRIEGASRNSTQAGPAPGSPQVSPVDDACSSAPGESRPKERCVVIRYRAAAAMIGFFIGMGIVGATVKNRDASDSRLSGGAALALIGVVPGMTIVGLALGVTTRYSTEQVSDGSFEFTKRSRVFLIPMWKRRAELTSDSRLLLSTDTAAETRAKVQTFVSPAAAIQENVYRFRRIILSLDNGAETPFRVMNGMYNENPSWVYNLNEMSGDRVATMISEGLGLPLVDLRT